LKENNFKPKLQYHDKQKIKEFMTTKPAIQKMLKGILYTEDEGKHGHEDMGKNKFHKMSR
jgi:hypothetical protein